MPKLEELFGPKVISRIHTFILNHLGWGKAGATGAGALDTTTTGGEYAKALTGLAFQYLFGFLRSRALFYATFRKQQDSAHEMPLSQPSKPPPDHVERGF